MRRLKQYRMKKPNFRYKPACCPTVTSGLRVRLGIPPGVTFANKKYHLVEVAEHITRRRDQQEGGVGTHLFRPRG